MKNLIISLAIAGRENYPELQKGLIETLLVAGDCDHWILNEYPVGITPHNVTPYLFKFDLIKKAVIEGYQFIWWLDSSMRLLRNPFELIEQSESGIVAFHNLGHPLYPKYISDLAAENTWIDYKIVLSQDNVQSTWGGAIGWDFNKSLPRTILSELFMQAWKGSFDNKGSSRNNFVAHRHDQSMLSVLLHFYKIPLLEYGIIAAKPHVTDKTYIQYGS